MKSKTVAALFAAAFLAVIVCAGVPGAEEAAAIEDQLLNEKCSLCHATKRLFRMDPGEIRETVERMRKMYPDWISTIESDHIAEVITKVVKDPSAVAQRKAWQEAVERGEKLFGDASLSPKGNACSTCHKKEGLRNVADAFPRWDGQLKRFVPLNEAINRMVEFKLEAEPFPPNDQRLFDLIAYLKSL